MSDASPAEMALARRIADGDEAAFGELVDAVGPTLQRLTRALVRNESVGEEVLQESWAGILDSIGRFEGRSALKTWACRILSNTAKKRTAREARSRPVENLGEDRDPGVDASRYTAEGFWSAPPPRLSHEETPEALALRREVRELVARELERLPEVQRAVVTLRDVEGWDSADVCNALDLTETNQRVILHRGRCRLRAALEGYLAKERA